MSEVSRPKIEQGISTLANGITGLELYRDYGAISSELQQFRRELPKIQTLIEKIMKFELQRPINEGARARARDS